MRLSEQNLKDETSSHNAVARKDQVQVTTNPRHVEKTPRLLFFHRFGPLRLPDDDPEQNTSDVGRDENDVRGDEHDVVTRESDVIKQLIQQNAHDTVIVRARRKEVS